jgi:nitroreductase
MNELGSLIQERHSVRGLYDPGRPVSMTDLAQILDAGRWAPTAHNMQNFEVIVVDDRKLLKELASIERSVSQEFVRENYQQLSFSEEELRRKKVGLLGTMFPAFMRTPGGKPDSAEAERMASFQSRLVQTSPALLVVTYDPARRAPASEGDFLGIMSLGCVMQNMWLMASSLGIALHILSSFSAGEVEGEVKRLLGIPEKLRVAFTARLGYPIETPAPTARVRRDVGDFSHRNRYGDRLG